MVGEQVQAPVNKVENAQNNSVGKWARFRSRCRTFSAFHSVDEKLEVAKKAKDSGRTNAIEGSRTKQRNEVYSQYIAPKDEMKTATGASVTNEELNKSNRSFHLVDRMLSVVQKSSFLMAGVSGVTWLASFVAKNQTLGIEDLNYLTTNQMTPKTQANTELIGGGFTLLGAAGMIDANRRINTLNELGLKVPVTLKVYKYASGFVATVASVLTALNVNFTMAAENAGAVLVASLAIFGIAKLTGGDKRAKTYVEVQASKVYDAKTAPELPVASENGAVKSKTKAKTSA